MISDGSCDTDENDAENSTLPSQEYILKKCIQIENSCLNCNNI